MAKENNGTVTTAMVGLDTRATMDMDATIKGLPSASAIRLDVQKKVSLVFSEIPVNLKK